MPTDLNQSPRDRFLVSLALGGFLALSSLPWLIVVGPVLGYAYGLSLFAVPALWIYLTWTAPPRGRGWIVATITSTGLVGIHLLTLDATLTLYAIPVVLGSARSIGLYGQTSAARALTVEAMLAAASLTVARVLFTGSLLSSAMAVWGFLLVQSLFFLIRNTGDKKTKTAEDPFETAYQRADSLLDSTSL